MCALHKRCGASSSCLGVLTATSHPSIKSSPTQSRRKLNPARETARWELRKAPLNQNGRTGHQTQLRARPASAETPLAFTMVRRGSAAPPVWALYQGKRHIWSQKSAVLDKVGKDLHEHHWAGRKQNAWSRRGNPKLADTNRMYLLRDPAWWSEENVA